MSSDTCCLALRLQGPLQSWGSESRYSRRTTSPLPSKSAIAGMLCAAMGFARGSAEERDLLERLASVPMLAVAAPRRRDRTGRRRLPGRTIDFHTIQGTRKATGKIKDCHITHRHYLHDSGFHVFLTGDAALLRRAGDALRDPVWGLWLGRKCCIPSAPVFAGLFADERAALDMLLGASPEEFTHEREVERFDEGSDSLSDQALSFLSSDRRFAPRRVLRRPGNAIS